MTPILIFLIARSVLVLSPESALRPPVTHIFTHDAKVMALEVGIPPKLARRKRVELLLASVSP